MGIRKNFGYKPFQGKDCGEHQRPLGAAMTTKIQFAALVKIDISQAKMKDIYLYDDDFQNFASQSFGNIPGSGLDQIPQPIDIPLFSAEIDHATI